MKLLMVVAHFVPEIASASHVYYDLARAFVKRGHEVDVLTYPRRFNLNEGDADRDFPLNETIDGVWGEWKEVSEREYGFREECNEI